MTVRSVLWDLQKFWRNLHPPFVRWSVYDRAVTENHALRQALYDTRREYERARLTIIQLNAKT